MRRGSGRILLVFDDFGGGDADGRAAVHVDAERGIFGDVAPRARHVGVAADDEAVLPVVQRTRLADRVWCVYGEHGLKRP